MRADKRFLLLLPPSPFLSFTLVNERERETYGHVPPTHLYYVYINLWVGGRVRKEGEEVMVLETGRWTLRVILY